MSGFKVGLPIKHIHIKKCSHICNRFKNCVGFEYNHINRRCLLKSGSVKIAK